jgi:hypothetical protein
MMTLSFSAHCARGHERIEFTDRAAFEAHMIGVHKAKQIKPGGALGIFQRNTYGAAERLRITDPHHHPAQEGARTMSKRIVYYIDQTMTDENGQYVPALVEENEPGYSPTTYKWGTDYAKARQWVDEANEKLGIDHVTAMKIVASSIAAHNRQA